MCLTRSVGGLSAIIPGPIKTASALVRARSRSSDISSPLADGRNPITMASGTATPTGDATASAVAICNRPAPMRSAATPASSTAPGVAAEPPMTRTVPRLYLSASARPGMGQRCKRSASSGLASMVAVSARGDGCIVILGHLDGRRFQGHGPIVSIDHKGLVAASDVRRQRTVRQRMVAGKRQSAVLVQVLQEVAPDHDHDLMSHQQHPLVEMRPSERVAKRPHSQGDVDPALTARGAMVELAEPPTSFRLRRIAALDTATREQVEDPELSFAEP